MTNNSQPPRRSLLREILELIKEHPSASKWMKILGGGYLIIQALGLLLGVFILYTIYSAFHEKKSSFQQAQIEFDRQFEEREKKFKSVWDELEDQTEKTRQTIESWERSKKSDNFKDPRQAKDIYSPDEADLTSSNNPEDNQDD